ncbi:hypothetical protein BH11PAT4_BH11PAT4_5060 [soil metagenome]
MLQVGGLLCVRLSVGYTLFVKLRFSSPGARYLLLLSFVSFGSGFAAYYSYAEVAGVSLRKSEPLSGENRILASSLAPVTPKSADSFIDGIGVDTHLFYSTYQQHLPEIKTLLSQSGIRFIRDGLPGTDNSSTGFKVFTDNLSQLVTPQGNRMKLLLTANYGTDITSSNYPTHHCFIIRVRRIVQAGQITCGNEQMHSTVGGTPLVAVEGPNEVDHCASFDTSCQTGGGSWYDKSLRSKPNWPAVMVSYMQDLNSTLGNEAVTSSTPILGPSFVHLGDFENTATGGGSNLLLDLQAMNSQLEYGNVHLYCDDDPFAKCAKDLSFANLNITKPAAFFTGKPMWTSETGYSKYNTAGSDAVSEIEQSKMSLRTLADLFDLGMQRSVLYEFYDQGAGAATPREGNFGLIRNDGSPKVAYGALKNMISLLQEAPGTSITATPLTYGIESTGATVDSTLLRKSNGKYYVLLRNNLTSVGDSDVNAVTALTFGTPISKVTTYRPSAGTGVLATFATQNITLNVPDDLLIAEVELAAEPVATPSPTPSTSSTQAVSSSSKSTPTPKVGSTTGSGETTESTDSGSTESVPATEGGQDSEEGDVTKEKKAPLTVLEGEDFIPALTRVQYVGMVVGAVATILGIILGCIERIRRIRGSALARPVAQGLPPTFNGRGGLAG